MDTALCVSSRSCVQTCPHDIWDFQKDGNGETFINKVKLDTCTKDMECVVHCPTGAIELIRTDF